MAATFHKEFSRWERSCDQECVECEGTGELGVYSARYDEVVGHPCPKCDGTGFKFSYPQDGLRVMSEVRRSLVRNGWANTRADYEQRRQRFVTRRTLGWMCFSLAERAIRTGVASDAAVAAWRAAA